MTFQKTELIAAIAILYLASLIYAAIELG